MTKLRLSVLTIITLLLSVSFFISCSNEETSAEQNKTALFNNKETKLLQKKYGFSNVSSFVDKSNETLFASLNLKNFSAKNSIDSNDLDLTKVTETVWENGGKSYFIPYKNNPNKSLVVSANSQESIDLSKAVIIENLVDENGNGEVITTSADGSSSKSFVNGKEKNTTIFYGRTFRQCFDAAYDTICDDFIGCVAWYSNPGVALMAAAYCQIHG